MILRITLDVNRKKYQASLGLSAIAELLVSDAYSDFDLTCRYNPKPDGNCQFESLSDHIHINCTNCNLQDVAVVLYMF